MNTIAMNLSKINLNETSNAMNNSDLEEKNKS
jgi:hypothetical protein